MKVDVSKGPAPVLNPDGSLIFFDTPDGKLILESCDVLCSINGASVACLSVDEEAGVAVAILLDTNGHPVPDGKGGLITVTVHGDVKLTRIQSN